AIESLPTKQQMVFNMKYFDDMKYDQIAEITGTTVGALKATYHFAVKKIEQFLKSR
ncbi:MAG: sigma-70 region 4 domain-containing protein, partial [Muribaculaceae bacterium]|nr:sigma-70 region 4 domain-containing protein [Muribaculaceae bacterium]